MYAANSMHLTVVENQQSLLQVGKTVAVVSGGMVMAGQGMTDQHRIGGVIVEGTVGLVDQLVAVQRRAAGQGQRVGKRLALGGDQADGVSR